MIALSHLTVNLRKVNTCSIKDLFILSLGVLNVNCMQTTGYIEWTKQ